MRGPEQGAPPSTNQRTILRQIVEDAGGLAAVLEKQFAVSRAVPDPDCPDCFELEVHGGVRLLPEETERPLAFGAAVRGREGMAMVLVWHEDGLVNGVEISWTNDPRPKLAELTIIDSYTPSDGSEAGSCPM